MQYKLIATDCDIKTLLLALQGKDRATAIMLSRSELHTLEMLVRAGQFYKREAEVTSYDKELGQWLWYIENNIRPNHVTNQHWELFLATEKTFPAQIPTDTEA